MTTNRLGLLVFGSFLLLAAGSGCANGSFKGKVVSCADQKPIPAAKLARETSGPAGNNNAGLFPGETAKDGTYSAYAGVPEGTVVTLKVEKEGFQPKAEKLTPGVDQTICLDPAAGAAAAGAGAGGAAATPPAGGAPEKK